MSFKLFTSKTVRKVANVNDIAISPKGQLTLHKELLAKLGYPTYVAYLTDDEDGKAVAVRAAKSGEDVVFKVSEPKGNKYNVAMNSALKYLGVSVDKTIHTDVELAKDLEEGDKGINYLVIKLV